MRVFGWGFFRGVGVIAKLSWVWRTRARDQWKWLTLLWTRDFLQVTKEKKIMSVTANKQNKRNSRKFWWEVILWELQLFAPKIIFCTSSEFDNYCFHFCKSLDTWLALCLQKTEGGHSKCLGGAKKKRGLNPRGRSQHLNRGVVTNLVRCE